MTIMPSVPVTKKLVLLVELVPQPPGVLLLLFVVIVVAFTLLNNMPSNEWPTVPYTTQDKTVFDELMSELVTTSTEPLRAKLTLVVV